LITHVVDVILQAVAMVTSTSGAEESTVGQTPTTAAPSVE